MPASDPPDDQSKPISVAADPPAKAVAEIEPTPPAVKPPPPAAKSDPPPAVVETTTKVEPAAAVQRPADDMSAKSAEATTDNPPPAPATPPATDRPPDAAPAAIVFPPNANNPPRANNPPNASAETTVSTMLRDLEAAVAKQPNDLERQLRLRMLYTVLGDEDKALKPTPGMNGDALEMVRGLVKPMIEVCKESNRDPAACATRQLAAVEELRQFLRTRADLVVSRLILCWSVDGYDQYDAVDPPEITAGEPTTCQLYIEIDNFHSERTPRNEFRTLLSMRTILLGKNGRELWSTVDGKVEDVARQPRRDFFLAKQIVFPDNLPTGDYFIKIEVEDRLGGKANSKMLAFKVTEGDAHADASAPSRRRR